MCVCVCVAPHTTDSASTLKTGRAVREVSGPFCLILVQSDPFQSGFLFPFPLPPSTHHPPQWQEIPQFLLLVFGVEVPGEKKGEKSAGRKSCESL